MLQTTNMDKIFHKLLIAFVFASFFITGTFAQNANDSSQIWNRELETLVISAERTPVSFNKLKRSIQVISKQEIAELPVRNVADLIGYALSTDVRSRGAFGMQADVSIRGGSYEQTLILLNGVNINDPQTGHHNMDIPVDLGSINRIEILKGPGARLFGPNAFNGVINIITNEVEEDKVKVSLAGGEYSLYDVTASAVLNFNKSTHKLSASKSASDGYTKNTDFEAMNFYYSATAGEKQQIGIQAAYTSKAFGANSFYTPKYPDQYEKTKTFFTTLQYKTGFRGFSPVVYYRKHNDEFRLFRNEAPSWYVSHNYHKTDVLGSNANMRFKTGTTGTLSIGYDLRYERIASNKLGDVLNNSIEIPGVDSAFYTRGKSRTSAGIFAEESISVGKLSVSGGLLLSYLESLDGKITIYPGIDLGYQLTDDFRIFANANRTLRLPTFTDLYYNDNTSKGDPGLKPEKAISAEVGLRYEKTVITAQTSIFKRFGTDMIDWVKLQDQDPWQAMNLTKVNVSGIESILTFNLKDALRNDFFIQKISFSYTYLKADKTSEDFMSRYALDLLRHNAGIQLYHSIWKGLTGSWFVHIQDRDGGYIKYIDAIPEAAETEYAPFCTTDVRLNYKMKHWNIFAEANNVFNVMYVDFGNVPQPGRWIRAGISFQTGLRKNKTIKN